jgi:hypothetical protein
MCCWPTRLRIATHLLILHAMISRTGGGRQPAFGRSIDLRGNEGVAAAIQQSSRQVNVLALNAGRVVGSPFLETALMAGDDKVVAGSVKNLLQTIAARLAPEQFEAATPLVPSCTKPKDLEEE